MKRTTHASQILPLVLAVLLHPRDLPAAPTVTRFLAGAGPAQARVGEPVVISARGLAAPVRLFFSNGTSPVVEATPVVADVGRGVLIARVPAGAATGNMKVTAAGVDSTPYFFRLDPGSFVPGTNLVGGQVTDGASPVPGAIVILFREGGDCVSDGGLKDFTTTAADGSYTVAGGDGSHDVLVFPPGGSGLATEGTPVTLSATPSTRDLSLSPGALVTGTVVDAGDPGIAVPGAHVSFDGAGSHEETYTDAAGAFAVRLLPGDWEYEVQPPAGDGHGSAHLDVLVGGTDLDLGDVPLPTGVRISGTLTRAADGSPLAGGEVQAYVSSPCCTDADEKFSAGDGSFVLVVPPSQTYSVVTQFEEPTTLADLRVDSVVVGTGDLTLDLAAADAAFITGTVTASGTGTPVPCLGVEARTVAAGGDSARAGTAADGTYRLRVAPDATGYRVTTSRPEEAAGTEYASQTWNGTPGGTYFPCEGVPVPAPTAGELTAGIDFVVPQAAAIEGQVSSQAGACGDDLANARFSVSVDDGARHMCTMGVADSSFGPPGYRMVLLPPGTGFRACVRLEGYDPQCYSLELSPAFDPISVAAGATASGIDFCLAACATPQPWFFDDDGDGYGAPGTSEYSCAQPAGYVSQGGDCDDGDPAVHPMVTETCNDTDDDCNGQVDDGNPGGGAPCATGLPGVCADGTVTCQGGNLDCVEDTPASPETCNNLDDDCDGTVDGHPTGCGTGACARTGTCTAGVDSCTPGMPAADDPTCNATDDDCDGQEDEDYASTPTVCGVGPCAAAGATSCVAGQVEDSCTPGTPAADDTTCDGTDDDCSGQNDEDYVPMTTTCGVGACAATGATSCVTGQVEDSCAPGGPGTETCNEVDDDCDGTTDNNVPGGCHLAVTDPIPDQVLDCRPDTVSPTIAWDRAGYDKFRVYLGADAAFTRKIHSGRRWRTTASWPIPARKWRRACALAQPTLYIRVQGIDVNLPRTDPTRKAFSPTVTAGTQR